jgi:hypothetical protein
MKKFTFSLIFFLSITYITFAQPEIRTKSLQIADTLMPVSKGFEDSLIRKISVSPKLQNGIILRGQVISIFHENIDSILIKVKTGDGEFMTYGNAKGIFGIEIPRPRKRQEIHFHFSQKDYRSLDTTFIYSAALEQHLIHVSLTPKYKILVRGRIFAMHTPLEGVDVTVKHQDSNITTKSLGCYFDDENYWNCLYDGMFKVEITTLNPRDSVWLTFSKPGFRVKHVGFVFADYKGDIMKFRLKYADSIPNFGRNNINLKMGFPNITGKDWFIGLSYYRQIKLGNFDRLAPGIESSIIVTDYKTTLTTLPGKPEATVDSAYVTAFVGPSLLVWITRPDRRYFSTYAGSTWNFDLNMGKIVVEPFLGTRFFLDMNKSLNIEARYYSYHLNVKEYTFNEFGNAFRSDIEKVNAHFIINIGLQVNF